MRNAVPFNSLVCGYVLDYSSTVTVSANQYVNWTQFAVQVN